MTGVGPPSIPVSSVPNSAGTDLDPEVQDFVDEFNSLQQTLEQYWSQEITGYAKPPRTLVFGGGTTDIHGTLASRADAFEYGREHGPVACLNPNKYRRR